MVHHIVEIFMGLLVCYFFRMFVYVSIQSSSLPIQDLLGFLVSTTKFRLLGRFDHSVWDPQILLPTAT